MARAGRRVDVCRRLLGDVRPAAPHVLRRSEGRDRRMKRLLVALSASALLLPANAFARGTFDPTTEFEQHEWIPIHLGPINMSITKAVAYLLISTVVTIAFGLFFMRGKPGRKAGRRETIGELVYDVAQQQVAEQGLPHKAIGRWFPYCARL